MKMDPARDSKTPTLPGMRQRQVHFGREDIRQTVQCKRSLMAEDAGSIGPEPHNHKVFILCGRKLDEPVYAPSHAKDSSVAKVVGQQLQ